MEYLKPIGLQYLYLSKKNEREQRIKAGVTDSE